MKELENFLMETFGLPLEAVFVIAGIVVVILAVIIFSRSDNEKELESHVDKADISERTDSELQSADVEKIETLAPEQVIAAPESAVVTPQEAVVPEITQPVKVDVVEETAEPVIQKESFVERMRNALSRSGSGISSLFGKKIDDDLLEELETALLMADVGVELTMEIIDTLTEHLNRHELKDGDFLHDELQRILEAILAPCEKPLVTDRAEGPFVILVIGVNGVGKTTTIGKLAKRLQSEGNSVMLAAGDTFRAAAVEQLQVWGERNNVPVVAQHTGADSASVIFDAIESAQAKNIDVVIADTAGRLHNKSHLMEELKKVHRVIGKLDGSAPHEVMIVLDAGTGQNAMSQMREFHNAIGITGVALTKLDGTAKGGIAFALSRGFGVPLRFVGVGEQIDDLQPFQAKAFVSALLGRE